MPVLYKPFQSASTRNHNHTLAMRSMVTGAKCARYDKLVSAPVNGGNDNSGGGNEPGGGGGGGEETPEPAA